MAQCRAAGIASDIVMSMLICEIRAVEAAQEHWFAMLAAKLADRISLSSVVLETGPTDTRIRTTRNATIDSVLAHAQTPGERGTGSRTRLSTALIVVIDASPTSNGPAGCVRRCAGSRAKARSAGSQAHV